MTNHQLPLVVALAGQVSPRDKLFAILDQLARNFPHSPFHFLAVDFASSGSPLEALLKAWPSTARVSFAAPPGVGTHPEILAATQGTYLVRHAHVIVAVHDDSPSSAVGDTPWLLGKAAEESCFVFELLSDRDFALSFSGEDSTRTSGTLGKQLDRWTKRHYAKHPAFAALVRLDRYNADLLTFDQARWEQDNGWQKASTLATEAALATPDQKPLLDIFVHKKFADDLANRYKALRDKALRFNLIAGILGAVFLNVYLFFPEVLAGLIPDFAVGLVSKGGLALFVLLNVVGYVVFSWIKLHRWETRFQDYRMFAELLRVQFHWSDAGVPARVSQHLNTRLDAAQEWLRKALSYLDTGLPALHERLGAQGPLALEAGKRRVLKDWVEDQEKYYRGKVTSYSKKKSPFVQSGFLGLSIALTVLVGVFFVVYLPQLLAELNQSVFTRFTKLGSFVINTVLGIGTAFRLYLSTQGFAELSAEYENSYSDFHKAHLALEATLALLPLEGDQEQWRQATTLLVAAGLFGHENSEPGLVNDRADAVLTELGLAALAENANWLQLNRSREIPKPKYTK